MMTFHKKALIAALMASWLPLMSGCKELGGENASESEANEISQPETGVTEPSFSPIRIHSAPLNLVGYPNQTATFEVVASSEASLTYQWFHNGEAISGATNATLFFSIAGIADAGTYEVVIKNSSTEARSSANLVVDDLPEITGEPKDVTIYPGETAVFTVDATGSDLSYKWQARSLSGWTTLDETSDTLVVENVSTSTKKQYRVKVSNDGGGKTSRTTRINLKQAISITSQPSDQLVAEGQNARFSVTASGYGTLSYQWLKAGSPISENSKFQGTRTASLGIANIISSDASLYSVVVTNGDGIKATSNTAELAIMGPAAVTVQPIDTTLYSGQSGTLKIAASGDKPISYQWQKLSGGSWQNVSGATSAQLSFSSATASTAGQYRCAVSNAASSDVSRSATVTVKQSVSISQSPQSQAAQVGDSVTFRIAASGDNLQYEWRKNGQVIPGNTSTLSFASIRELDEATYGCRVYNEGSSQNCSSFSLDIQSPVAIITQPVSQTTYEGGSTSLTVSASGDPTPTVEWYHDSKLVGTGKTLALNYVTLAQAGDYRCLVKNTIGSVYCDPVTLTVNESVAIISQPTNMTADEGSELVLTLEAKGDGLNYAWTKDGVAVGNSATLTLSDLTDSNAGTYSCRVWNDSSSDNCSSFTVSINGKISITKQPVATSGYEGDAVKLSVAHTGLSDTKVQWYRNGSLLAATSATLTLSPLTMDQAGDYHCIVSNSVNSVTCSTASVKVLEKVRITKQPSSQILPEGEDIVLDIQATGALPITYQCFKGNSLLITTSSVQDLIIPASTASDTGDYYCVVSNEGTSATSNIAEISILANNDGAVLLSWQAPAYRTNDEQLSAHEIQGYNIYMSTTANGTYEQVKTTSGTSAEITGLANGTYYFKLSTLDNSGLESALSAPVAVEI